MRLGLARGMREINPTPNLLTLTKDHSVTSSIQGGIQHTWELSPGDSSDLRTSPWMASKNPMRKILHLTKLKSSTAFNKVKVTNFEIFHISSYFVFLFASTAQSLTTTLFKPHLFSATFTESLKKNQNIFIYSSTVFFF